MILGQGSVLMGCARICWRLAVLRCLLRPGASMRASVWVDGGVAGARLRTKSWCCTRGSYREGRAERPWHASSTQFSAEQQVAWSISAQLHSSSTNIGPDLCNTSSISKPGAQWPSSSSVSHLRGTVPMPNVPGSHTQKGDEAKLHRAHHRRGMSRGPALMRPLRTGVGKTGSSSLHRRLGWARTCFQKSHTLDPNRIRSKTQSPNRHDSGWISLRATLHTMAPCAVDAVRGLARGCPSATHRVALPTHCLRGYCLLRVCCVDA